ncbi:hypothetical protein HHK36_024092 [Tetracentron sinense]|uniref:Uncharacterized protein n=1 Tax=Tetracentron sinense TaxID=13715 RepID=A0A834YM02_TETSI|nr:hypothetical protein HHK36_024092 [Tetracentron sinense]
MNSLSIRHESEPHCRPWRIAGMRIDIDTIPSSRIQGAFLPLKDRMDEILIWTLYPFVVNPSYIIALGGSQGRDTNMDTVAQAGFKRRATDWSTPVEMASYLGRGVPSNGSVYVCNLPDGTDENMLAEFFGTIGLLKKDKRTGRPKIWLYRDKVTNEPKGDAMVTFEDPHAAMAAVDWFNNKDFHGNAIGVFIAESKSKDVPSNSLNQMIHVGDPTVDGDFGGQEEDVGDMNGDGGGDGGQVDASGKAWQQEGDWLCPNTSCSNVNFAFRGVCNRCGSARPIGASGGGAGAGGRGRGRGGNDSGGRGRTGGAPTGLFGPNDWSCPMCANINWAKRTKCNICNTNKPGHNEGGVRY